MVIILLWYTSAFSEEIYADYYAKILDWNFRLINENSQILVDVFVSKFNLFLVFVSTTKTAEFLSSSSSLWRKLIYFRQRKFSFSSSSTKKNTDTNRVQCDCCDRLDWAMPLSSHMRSSRARAPAPHHRRSRSYHARSYGFPRDGRSDRTRAGCCDNRREGRAPVSAFLSTSTDNAQTRSRHASYNSNNSTHISCYYHGTDTVQITPLRRTLASSP